MKKQIFVLVMMFATAFFVLPSSGDTASGQQRRYERVERRNRNYQVRTGWLSRRHHHRRHFKKHHKTPKHHYPIRRGVRRIYRIG